MAGFRRFARTRTTDPLRSLATERFQWPLDVVAPAQPLVGENPPIKACGLCRFELLHHSYWSDLYDAVDLERHIEHSLSPSSIIHVFRPARFLCS
jgi:hypothetical protein